MEGAEEEEEAYIPNILEQRGLFKTARNDYRQSMPSWSDYMPEETQQEINDFRDSYEGKKPWWESNDFNVDFEPVRNDWKVAVKDWKTGRPTWDSWSVEQAW